MLLGMLVLLYHLSIMMHMREGMMHLDLKLEPLTYMDTIRIRKSIPCDDFEYE